MIMQDCMIQAGAYLDRVILDKQVVVEQGRSFAVSTPILCSGEEWRIVRGSWPEWLA